MSLSREIYQEFEAVVGPENISQSPVVLETYRCKATQSSAHYGPYDHRTPTPQAVILPGSAEEVQKIVLLCNQYKLHFKASGTFWSAHGYISSDDAIQVDMRRMRDIWIDEKNMIAQVGPYVSAAQLNAEAMRHGLTCNVPGVGASSSVVANTIGWMGSGPMSIYTGNTYENLLSSEWVLPSGELFTTGSLGSGCGWACGEGPGPSMRAIIRSTSGMAGEMGICTRIAVRLSPWAGPKTLPVVGKPPAYRTLLDKKKFRFYILDFPSWDAWADAISMIWENDIAFALHRQFSMFGRDLKAAMLRILNDPDGQLADIPALLEREDVQEETRLMHTEICCVLMGMDEDDLAWREDVLHQILAQTGGQKDPMMSEPEMEQWGLLYFVRMGHKNLNYAYCSSYEGHFGHGGKSIYDAASVLEEAAALRREWEHRITAIGALGGDSALCNPGSNGGGGIHGWENFLQFDAHDKDSIKGAQEFIDFVSAPFLAEHGYGMDFGNSNENCRRPDGYAFTREEQDALFAAAPCFEHFLYQWKIMTCVNPNRLDNGYYFTLDPKAVGRE